MVAVLIAAVAAVLVMWDEPQEPQGGVATVAVVTLAAVTFRLEVADRSELWSRGLAGRAAVPENGGMIFVFPAAAPHAFWMKGMRVPIDIVWLRGQRLVSVTANVLPEPGKPDSLLTRYPSPGPVDTVIELRAGRAAELGIHPGQEVSVVLP